MPKGKHLKGVTKKQNRQYEHIKAGYVAKGRGEKEAKRIAAATVNKQKSFKHKGKTIYG